MVTPNSSWQSSICVHCQQPLIKTAVSPPLSCRLLWDMGPQASPSSPLDQTMCQGHGSETSEKDLKVSLTSWAK